MKGYNAFLAGLILAAIGVVYVVAASETKRAEAHLAASLGALEDTLPPQTLSSSWTNEPYRHEVTTAKRVNWTDRELLDRHFAIVILASSLSPSAEKPDENNVDERR